MVLPTLLQVLLYAAVVLLSYALLDQVLNTYSHRLSIWLRPLRRYSLRELDQMVRIALWPLALVGLLCPAVLAILAVKFSSLLMESLDPWLLLFGILVGLGEAGVAEFVCLVAVCAVPALAWADGAGGPDRRQLATWSTAVPCTRTVSGLSFMLALMLLYAAVEETTLRAAVIVAALPLGPIVALACAVALSLAVQFFPTTSGQRRSFAVIGTLVAAPVHGALFLAAPDVRPLIIAQFVLLLRTAA